MNKGLLLLLMLISNAVLPGTFQANLNALTLKMKIIGVKDGDTVDVLYYQFPINIRLQHIDAPEKKQAFGTKSKEKLSELCFGKNPTPIISSPNFTNQVSS